LTEEAAECVKIFVQKANHKAGLIQQLNHFTLAYSIHFQKVTTLHGKRRCSLADTDFLSINEKLLND